MKLIEVSYSEIDAYRQCPLKHHLSYRERWQPAEVSKPLQIGSLFHKRLEAYYSGKAWSISAYEEGVDAEVAEIVKWMFEGYLERYSPKEDSAWEVLEVEMRVEGRLPTLDGGKSGFKLKGFVDLLVRDWTMDGLWIVDHKTGSRLPKGKDFDFDDQFGLYLWLLRQKGLDVRGVIHNACITKKLVRPMTLEERFKRSPTVRSDVELETVAREAYQTMRNAYRVSTKDPSGSSTLPPRSPDPDRCGWRCGFTEACLMSRKGPSIQGLLADMGSTRSLERH